MIQRRIFLLVISISLLSLILAFNIAWVRAEQTTLSVADFGKDGVSFQVNEGDPITASWESDLSVDGYIYTAVEYNNFIGGGVSSHEDTDTGTKGSMSTTARTTGTYYIAFYNGNSQYAQITLTYTFTPEFPWWLVAGILLIVGTVIVGIVAIKKGYILKRDKDGSLVIKKP